MKKQTMAGRLMWLALMILAISFNVMGQTPTAARPDRGSRSTGSYSSSDIDDISLTNGNVNVSIPLATLPQMAGGELSWALNAHYNSKLWDVTRSERIIPTGSLSNTYIVDSLQLSDTGGWRIGEAYSLIYHDSRDDFDWAQPVNQNDPDISLLQYQWGKYVLTTPDGTEHELRPLDYQPFSGQRDFLKGYYKDNPDSIIPKAAMRYYSFDGSFIWAVIYPTTTGSPIRWEVYMPDGTHIVQRNNQGAVQKIWDTNNNVINISTTTDANGVVTTSFQDGTAQGPGPREIQFVKNGTARQVKYRKVGGEWVTINITLGSTLIQGKTYRVNDLDVNNQPCTRTEAFFGTTTSVISSITLPQTEPGQSGRQYVFSYNSDTAETTSLPYQIACGSPSSTITTSSKGMGSLSQILMPSGATIKYTYYQDTLSGNSKHQLFSADEAAREPITQKRIIHDNVIDDWNYSISTVQGSVTAPDSSTTTERFYLHDRGAPGYYGGSSGVGGLVYRTTQSATTMIERHWTSLLFSGAAQIGPGGNLVTFNPVVDVEYTSLLDPSTGNKLKMSASKFTYDFNGNLIQQTDYDWFDPSLVAGNLDPDGVPMGVPGGATVLRVIDNTFYNQAPTSLSSDSSSYPEYINVYARRATTTATPLILNAQASTDTSDATATVLSRSRYAYDGATYGVAPTTKGNLTAESVRLIQGGGSWIDTTHTYDAYGNRLTTTAPSGAGFSTTTWVYDDPQSSEHTYAQPIKVTVNPGTGNQTATTAYDYWTGMPISQTDVNGNVTTTDYTNQRLNVKDPYNRPGLVTMPAVTSVVDGVGTTGQQRKIITNYYDNASADNASQVEVFLDLKSFNDKLLRSRSTYDQMGRVVLSESSEDSSSYTISSQTVYHQMGRVTLSSNPQRSGAASTDGWTRTILDDARRVKEVATFATATLPPDSGTNANHTGTVTTTYTGNTTTVVDQAGKKRRSVVDALGRLTRADEPDLSSAIGNLDNGSGQPLQPTSYGYDALGNLTSVLQGTQTRAFRYDSLSRLILARNPEQQINSSLTQTQDGTQWSMGYSYDPASNLLTRTNPNGTTVSFTYDGLNRAITKTLSNPGVTWNYTYDTGGTNPKGRLIKVVKSTSNEGTYYDNYDAGGRLQTSRQITKVGTQEYTYTTNYGYDLAGNLTKEMYPSGKVYGTIYDNAGRVAGVKNQTANTYYAGAISTDTTNRVQYTPHGAISAMKMGNNRWQHTNFNNRLQPINIGLGNSISDSSLLRLDYTYNTLGQADNNGNLLQQSITVPKADNTLAVMTQSYTYDSLNRLKTAGETSNWSQTYDYDRFGNRAVRSGSSIPAPGLTPTSTTGGSLSAVISSTTNRLLVSGYTYDSSGNVTADPSTGANAIVYDSENRQTSYTKMSTTNYEYDADGRRVKKSDSTGTLVMVYDAMGKLIAEYRDDPLPPAQAGGGTSYLTMDALGSTRVVTGESGQVKSRHDYLPFGEEITLAIAWGVRSSIPAYSATDGQRQRFTSKERDDESGLDYFLARYYSSAQGRFASPDEFAGGPDEFWVLGSGDEEDQALPYADIEDPQTLNKYQYCLNNPLRFIDLDGHLQGPGAETMTMDTGGLTLIYTGGRLILSGNPYAEAAGGIVIVIGGAWYIADRTGVYPDGSVNPIGPSYPRWYYRQLHRNQQLTQATRAVDIPNRPMQEAEHTSNASPSKAGKHAKGRRRNKADKGGEKADAKRQGMPGKKGEGKRAKAKRLEKEEARKKKQEERKKAEEEKKKEEQKPPSSTP